MDGQVCFCVCYIHTIQETQHEYVYINVHMHQQADWQRILLSDAHIYEMAISINCDSPMNNIC